MKRHDTDVVSLVFALVFLVVAAMWPLWTVGVLDTASLRWVPATALVLIGVVGVALSILRSRNPATEPVPQPVDLGAYSGPPQPVDLAAYSAPTPETSADPEASVGSGGDVDHSR